MSRRARLAAVFAGLLLVLPTNASAETWSFTDGSGKTATLDHVPTRIVAHAWAAAGLIAYGIRPVGIYADGPVKDEPALRGVDLTGIEIVGEVWGEMNVEKIATLKPDLIVGEWWPLEQTYSGFEKNTNGSNTPVLQLAPVIGIAQGNSVVTMIEDYGRLAESLGVDLSAPEIVADKAEFDSALADFKSAVTSQAGLKVLAVWAGADGLYVAAPAGSAELSDFLSWGLDLVVPAVADDRGYWETLSWEQADKYQVDLIMVDDRQASTRQNAEAQPMWTTIKAAAAGQVTDWPAFWIRSYDAYARELRELTAAINAADPALVD